MTYGPSNARSSYLPVEFDIPSDDRIREFISKRERLTADILNIKENANYELNELITAQEWFSTQASTNPRKQRYSFRKVISFGTLPSTTKKSVAHGISITQSTIFTRIFATATSPGAAFIPIPFINTTTPGDSVQLDVDTTNVNITTTTANYVAYTTCYVVLEYIKF